MLACLFISFLLNVVIVGFVCGVVCLCVLLHGLIVCGCSRYCRCVSLFVVLFVWAFVACRLVLLCYVCNRCLFVVRVCVWCCCVYCCVS